MFAGAEQQRQLTLYTTVLYSYYRVLYMHQERSAALHHPTAVIARQGETQNVHSTIRSIEGEGADRIRWTIKDASEG